MKRRVFRIALLLGLVALIGWADFESGPDIGFSLFYLIPVAAAGWFHGSISTAIVATSASVAWFYADFLWNPTQIGVTAWNSFTRFAMFVAIGVLMSKLRDERERLQKANAELEAFTYSVSHDLRSPLVHIGSYAHMLQKRAATSIDDVSRHYLATINESSEVALRLMDDLLDFSRIGRTEIRRSDLNLADLVNEERRTIDAANPARELEWRIGPLPHIRADAPMIRVAIHNLLDNAVKYTRKRQDPIIEVTSEMKDGEIIVAVRDNGVGFDPKYKAKLFRVFERLHNESEFEGSGIGLAVVERIVGLHGGRVWAEGEVGRGATFYFTLPDKKTK